MRISTYTFTVPYWRYLTHLGHSIILWLYLINAIVYTFSPALAVSKNPTNATVVAAESTNENLNSTQLNDQRILEEFQVKSPDWTDIRLTIIEVTISILGINTIESTVVLYWIPIRSIYTPNATYCGRVSNTLRFFIVCSADDEVQSCTVPFTHLVCWLKPTKLLVRASFQPCALEFVSEDRNKTPPSWIVEQMLDNPRDRAALLNLVSVAGSSPAAKNEFAKVFWRILFQYRTAVVLGLISLIIVEENGIFPILCNIVKLKH